MNLAFTTAQNSESFSDLAPVGAYHPSAEDSTEAGGEVSKYQKAQTNNKVHLVLKDVYSQLKTNMARGNSSIGFTYMSNYHKNVPSYEQTLDDNIHYRSYIQTTSGAIFYYDEIVRIGRRN
ncbi:hypothetical protein JCM30197_13600 [Schleiferia thermophila]|nr:hypothetical protein JCM30197_13600 [Schleiferia thermophila]